MSIPDEMRRLLAAQSRADHEQLGRAQTPILIGSLAVRLREQADYVERLATHDDMGLSIALSQTADTLRWAADAIAALRPWQDDQH